jgi:F0F1-type ATP synthase assembly protein I
MSKEQARLARQVGLLTAIPFILLAGPVLGFLVGSWLDRKLGTEPILLIVLLLVGLAASGRETYKLIQMASREDVDSDDGTGRGDGVPPKDRPRQRD